MHEMNSALRAVTVFLIQSATVFISAGHVNELDYVEATCHDKTDETQPILLVDNDTADLGAIKKDDVRQHSFRIINTGKAPLCITNVYSGIRCNSSDNTHS
ncbi:MAG: DUF1573 domain-containing protein, partial [Lactobacillus sp.]|nr:DUF1573 domain-containing protein [Lactobacillus sp.]